MIKNILSAFLQGLATLSFLSLAAFSGVSCDKSDPNAARTEFIEVYSSLDEDAEPLAKAGFVGVRKGDYVFYVKTNIPQDKLQFEWQDADSNPWAKISSVTPVEASDYLAVKLYVKARTAYSYYTRRSGVLMISAPEINAGKYLTVHQGCVARYSNNFATFTNGSKNPLDSDGEKNYSEWTTAQKNNILTENFAGTEVSYLYGGNDFVKLGDDKGHGACLLTPFVDNFRADSLLMVSFRAIAYADKVGKDDNKLTVEILGGGIFRDQPEQASTKMVIDVPHIKYDDPDLEKNLWNDAEFMLFVMSTDKNPITANTQIRFTSGSLQTQSSVNSRIFMDNLYVRRLSTDLDEDYFEENGGSGVDRILGLSSAEQSVVDNQE